MSRLVQDIESCFEGGWSDGLPVVPPYASLVDAMLERMGHSRAAVLGSIPEQNIEILAEQVAATAVMAGCKPEYGPLLSALTSALLAPEFNLSGVEVTTGGAAALVIVSGPIAARLGFESGANCLGANCRANATVGRFAAMVRYFCGRAGGLLDAHGTIGHPGRLSFCIAEHPQTVWPSFATQLGYPAGCSAVTLMATEGPVSVNNHYGTTGQVLLETISDAIAQYGSTNYYWRGGGYLVVLPPEHRQLISAAYSRDEARRYLYEQARRPTDELRRMGRLPVEPMASAQVVPGMARSPMANESQLLFIESGKAGGKFSAVVPGWVASHTLCRLIREDA